MSDFSERIRRLSPAQRELLFRGLHRPEQTADSRRIRRRESAEPAPLSFAQQRLWFLDELGGIAGAYHVPVVLELRGPLDACALKHSLQAVCSRHEILRTTFPSIGGQPRQVILDAIRYDLPPADLRSEPERQQADLQRRIEEELGLPFSLARGPLLRAQLLRWADDCHVLLLTLHHIVADGWSLGILTRELAAFYTAFRLGVRLSLPPLPVQYADFAIWQQQQWDAGEFEPQLAHWCSRLKGLPPLHLPADRLRPAIPLHRGDSVTLALPGRLVWGLEKLSRDHKATLFMTILAAFQLLLSWYSDQEDIAVGCPIAGRVAVELEELIGCFVNVVILRADLSGDPNFRDLLTQVRDTVLESHAHQNLPFEKLVERLRPPRDVGSSPLIQALVAMQNAPRFPLDMADLSVGSPEVKITTARFDLELNIWQTPLGVRLILVYSSDLFERDTIQGLLSHFQVLLERVVAGPDRRLSALALPPQAERKQVLLTWQWVTPDDDPEEETFEF